MGQSIKLYEERESLKKQVEEVNPEIISQENNY